VGLHDRALEQRATASRRNGTVSSATVGARDTAARGKGELFAEAFVPRNDFARSEIASPFRPHASRARSRKAAFFAVGSIKTHGRR